MTRAPHKRGRAVVGAGLRNSAPTGTPVHNVPNSLLQPTAGSRTTTTLGNELCRLMLSETKSEAGFRTRSLRDAQLVLA